jgi:hypothetical protein
MAVVLFTNLLDLASCNERRLQVTIKKCICDTAWEARMFSSEVTLLLRTILNEVCAGLAEYETGKRTLVASKILESASKGERNIYMLRSVGRQALLAAPF